MLPKTLNDAVAAGLVNLTSDARKELAEVGFIDPHTKYRTDFEKVVSDALGLNDGSNQELLINVALNHAEALNFLESDGQQLGNRTQTSIHSQTAAEIFNCYLVRD